MCRIWMTMIRNMITEIASYCSTLKLQHHQRMFIRTAVNLSFKVLGDNPNEPGVPPLLIFHGLLGAKRHWEGLGKTILNMTKKSVIVADLRNHGHSPRTGDHNYNLLAKDILQLLSKLQIHRASLLGHSMGGRAVMAASLLAPEKVAGIVVVDISPVSSCKMLTEHIPKLLDLMSKVDIKGAKDVTKARKAVKEQLREHVKDEVFLRAAVSSVRKNPEGGAIGYWCNLDGIIKNINYITSFPNELKEMVYDGPALFIGGQLSEFIPPDDLPEIRSMFPRAVVTYIKGAGHNVHVDDPKTFLEYTIKFIREIK